MTNDMQISKELHAEVFLFQDICMDLNCLRAKDM